MKAEANGTRELVLVPGGFRDPRPNNRYVNLDLFHVPWRKVQLVEPSAAAAGFGLHIC